MSDSESAVTRGAVRQRRSLARPAATAVALLLLPFAAFLTFDKFEHWRAAREIERLHISDEELRGYLQPKTEEQKRASHLYGEAYRLADAASPLGARGPSVEAAPLVDALQTFPAGRLSEDPRFKRLRAIEAPFDRALALLDRASPLDARGLAEEDVPEGFTTHPLASANALRVTRLALAGDAQGASAALLAGLRLRRVSPPGMWSQYFRSLNGLELLLTRARPSDPALAALQQEYVRFEMEDRVESLLEGARVRLLQILAPEQFGDVPWAAGSSRRTSPAVFVLARVSRPFRTHQLAAELRTFDAVFAAAGEPWPAKIDALNALAGARRSAYPARRSLLRTLLAPLSPGYAAHAGVAAVTSMAETLAQDRISIVAIGIARYQSAHGGALPAALGNLVPTYLSTVPLDPYTGRELFYAREAGGFEVYSAGVNRKDDGGVWYVRSDLSPYRRGDPKDIGMRALLSQSDVARPVRRR